MNRPDFVRPPSRALPPRLDALRGSRVLVNGHIGPARIDLAGARIETLHVGGEDAGPTPAACLDAGDMLLLPGIVDLHGDAFERAVMPRPGVSFSYDQALHDVDRQLLGNGITTEFHGVTLSWEGGLRGRPYAQRMFDALARHADELGARHQVHLRFETHNLDDIGIACEWIENGTVHFLALNNHLPTMAKRIGDDRKLLQYADRAECDLDTFASRIRRALAVSNAVPDAIRELIACAREAGVRVASHDDETPASRRHHDALGCSVAEFVMTPETARTARELGNPLVFGAPNVVRGRSHTTAPNATEMIRAGLCDILTSDYYYPALLAAVIQLDAQGVLPLEQGWRLVSANPARAAGLDDRGEFARGMYADAIVVDDSIPGLPRVCAAIVGGRLRYANGGLSMPDTASTAAATSIPGGSPVPAV